MRILLEKTIVCSTCGKGYTGKRQEIDARCSPCRQAFRKAYLKAWRKRPVPRIRRIARHLEIRRIAIGGYGGKCACCGEHNFEFLAIDHVNGGGSKERKHVSTRQLADRVIRLGFPPEYRVLCHNCNASLGWYGGCPHNPDWERIA